MNTTTEKRLLSIRHFGGYPDFTRIYRKVGFKVQSVSSLRHALNQIREWNPDCVVTEFCYKPTYGTQLSNLESLFAALQRHMPESRMIVFYDKEDSHHLAKLENRFPIFGKLTFPILTEQLEELLVCD